MVVLIIKPDIMKHSLLITLLTVLCLGVIACSKDEKTVTGGSGTPGTDSGAAGSGTLDYSGLTATNHPRIIFTNDGFEAVKNAYDEGSNTYLNAIHEAIISLADSYIGASDLTYTLTGKRLLTVCRNAEARILCCAYAYKTTGETKYLDQAEHDIQTVCGFQDWNCPQHSLDVGEMATGVGLGYDWLFNDLSSSTKILARNALNNFAFTPVLNGETSEDFYSVTDNWNQVCNAGLVCAALAIYENNQSVAQSFIEKALETNVACMSASYTPDGNYAEGYGYWDYGTMYEVLMLTALETAVGSDNGLSKTEGFSKTGQYVINALGSSGYCFNYSDAQLSTAPGLAVWYFAWKFGDASVLYKEKDRINKYKSAGHYRLLPVIAWYASQIDVADVAAPEEPIWHGDGTTPVVLVHDTWTMDENDKFLGIKGGKAKTNHGHMDAGSFVYDADGVRWASDYEYQDYTSLEPYISLWSMVDGSDRWTSFRLNNFNHNTITINDAYHLVAGVASFTDVFDEDGRKGATIDISAPLSGEAASVIRTIYIEGDDLVVEDKITALGSKAANVRWTLVTQAEPTIEYGSITLKLGKLTRYLTSTSGVVWQTWSTVSENSWDRSNDGFYECGYTLTVNAGTSSTVTVRLTPTDPLG